MLRIGIGSKTSTGGVVVEGNTGLQFDGLVASSIGHKATCPACKKGIGEMIPVGPRSVMLPAGLAARAGDYIACGCPPHSNVLIAEGTISIGSQGSAQQNSQTALRSPGASKKSVTRIYWSHGDKQTPLQNASRFYTDMNLHAETVGYQPGETLEITLEGASSQRLQGVVDANGKVCIQNALKSHDVHLQGRI